MKKNSTLLISVLAMFMMLSGVVFSQTTEFTYQGQLQNSSVPATGLYDFEFRLFDLAGGGTQQGLTLQRSVAVANGIFSVSLDFGAVNLPGADRFLDISVRLTGGGAFTPLTPRQKVNSAPYAVRSLNAGTADSVLAAGIPTGSANYVQNTTSPQSSSNFNISGSGTAGGTLRGNIIKADTQFDLGGDRIIFRNGSSFFVGPFTGNSTTGPNNSFFGNTAGFSNTTGSNNTFLGFTAGTVNTTGSFNSFFGSRSGFTTQGGSQNAFYGADSGRDNVTGSQNAFFGNAAGLRSTGSDNSFIGGEAGSFNTSGTSNVFIGRAAGQANTTGSNNTLVGTLANLAAANLTFATAIGAGANVTTSNTLVLGRNLDTVQVPGTLSISGTLASNIFNATTQYNIAGERVLGVGTSSTFVGVDAGASSTGASNTFLGFQAGSSVTTAQQNTFVGRSAGANATGGANSFFGASTGQNVTGLDNTFIGANSGFSTSTGMRNTFVGRSAGFANTTGNDNTLLGNDAAVGSGGLTFATAIGADAVVSTSSTIALGRADGSDKVRVFGLGTAGATALCRNANNEISTCSSSLRYKTDVKPFKFGLDLVNRLRPITFSWKDGGMADLGLGAEDVAAVEPLLVTYNKGGQVEGVKYDRVGVVLVNAVKEQQQQIETQQRQLNEQNELIKKQQAEIDVLKAATLEVGALKNLICSQNPAAALCKPLN